MALGDIFKSKDNPSNSAAEQDRYASHFGSNANNPTTSDIKIPLPQGSGAEQDRYASHWSLRPDNPVPAEPVSSPWKAGGVASGAEQDRLASHFSSRPTNPIRYTSVGILQSTILPSLGLHSGLTLIAYAAGRATDRAELKDWAWPSAPVLNAWWSALGTRIVYDGLDVKTAWSTITYPEKLLLGVVTAWGGRLFYRIASRSIKRGRDDPRYEAAKKSDPEFWNKTALKLFAPEVIFQTLISLPYVLPFRAPVSSAVASVPEYAEVARAVAAFLFGSGLALEFFADSQLASHQKQGRNDLNRSGVWSVVRHPNYLGDTLIHASVPLLLYSANLLNPVALLGPIANYLYLRFYGGDKETESHQADKYLKENPAKYAELQEYKKEKNSFWPKPSEVTNPWTLTVAAVGVGAVVLEKALRTYL